jgi:hypothetical protein
VQEQIYHVPDRKKNPTMKSSKNNQSSKVPAICKKQEQKRKSLEGHTNSTSTSSAQTNLHKLKKKGERHMGITHLNPL